MILVSPREAWLEREYSRLSSENTYLKERGNAPQYSILEDPSNIQAHTPFGMDMKLAIQADTKLDPVGYHVKVTDLTNPKHLQIGYFVDKNTLHKLHPTHKAEMMIKLHDDLVLDLGRKLWNN